MTAPFFICPTPHAIRMVPNRRTSQVICEFASPLVTGVTVGVPAGVAGAHWVPSKASTFPVAGAVFDTGLPLILSTVQAPEAPETSPARVTDPVPDAGMFANS